MKGDPTLAELDRDGALEEASGGPASAGSRAALLGTAARRDARALLALLAEPAEPAAVAERRRLSSTTPSRSSTCMSSFYTEAERGARRVARAQGRDGRRGCSAPSSGRMSTAIKDVLGSGGGGEAAVLSTSRALPRRRRRS